MKIRLKLESSNGTWRTVAYDLSEPLLLGRDPTCAIVIDADEVSRKHLTILWLPPDRILVRDHSANGSRVMNIATGDITPLKRAECEISLPAVVQVASWTLTVQPADEALYVPVTARSPFAFPSSSSSASSDVVRPDAFNAQSTGSVAKLSPERPASFAPGAPSELKQRFESSGKLRRAIHRKLLEHLDLVSIDLSKMDVEQMRPQVEAALRRIVLEMKKEFSSEQEAAVLVAEMTDEVLGWGPLESLLKDESVTEVMVVDYKTIYVERAGRLERSHRRFTDEEAVRAIIERIVTPLGRRIDESTPLVDARLPDGSRVNAVIRPLALRGGCITIRKFASTPLQVETLITSNSLSDSMAKFLMQSVACRKNILISGGTGSGKTTLMNVLSAGIGEDERVVTIEDSAELKLFQPHVVSLEARPANLEGKGEYTIRDLLRNALRMRPDRILVGECRGGEALDMLQAMNTGHEGSMTTLHANSPHEALARLEMLVLMSGLDLPLQAIRMQISQCIHLIVQQTRLADGTRKITSVSEVLPMTPQGEIPLREIFRFDRTGTSAAGNVLGTFTMTGYLPSFLGDFVTRGLITEQDGW